MSRLSRRIRAKERRFLAFLALNAALIGGVVGSSFDLARQQAGGWRQIDSEALEERLRDGRLVRQEAQWYRVIPDADGPGR